MSFKRAWLEAAVTTNADLVVGAGKPSTNESRITVMQDFFASPSVRVGIVMLVLCVLIGFSFYLVSIFRGYADEDHQDPTDPLANLEEMHRKGDISDQEFRKIQTKTNRFPVGPDAVDELTSDADSSANEQS
ncbi:hypothetical protein N9D23_08505 [Rubripirellula sp.]|nr:hypothetical protein [Planctomycetaceae bacterium]MDA9858151.1 hypothetical protein [Rubripirellula sp.]